VQAFAAGRRRACHVSATGGLLVAGNPLQRGLWVKALGVVGIKKAVADDAVRANKVSGRQGHLQATIAVVRLHIRAEHRIQQFFIYSALRHFWFAKTMDVSIWRSDTVQYFLSNRFLSSGDTS